MPSHKEVQHHLDAVIQEMHRVKLWQDKPLAPEQLNFSQAFAMDTMSFNQWLQFIFIPRVQQIIDSKGKFPSQSNVAAQAVREFDGMDEASELVGLLSEFDALFEE